MPIETLTTTRLILNELGSEDAEAISHLASDKEISDGVIGIPHPYSIESAFKWIESVHEGYKNGSVITYAVRDIVSKELYGCATLFLTLKHQRAEVGYWIGKKYWNSGYATEATKTLIAYAFEKYNLNRIDAAHFAENEASRKVIEKLGFSYEGLRKNFFIKNGKAVDSKIYGLVRKS